MTRETVRVSIWPRSQGVPNLIHILNPSVLLLNSNTPKLLSYSEIFVPTANLVGFHMALPKDEPLDYDPSEKNRFLSPISLIMGSFIVKGHIRIASSASLSTSLEVMYHGWLSIYDAEITNPMMPNTQPMQVKLLLVKPSEVSFLN